MTQARATLLVLFSACCFGSIGILISVALGNGANLSDALAWRYGIAAVLLFVVSGGLPALRAPGKRAWLLVLLAGGGQAIIAFLSLSALKYIPAASVTFLFYTYPAWVTLMSAVRGIDRLTPVRLGALVLSLGGLAVMIGTPGAGGLNPIGASLALTSAVIYAMYIPMMNTLGRDLPPAVTSSYAAAGAGVIFMLAAAGQGTLSIQHTSTAWAMIAILAVICTVVAFILFLRGLVVLGPVRTAIVSTIEPFWAALLGAIVLHQALGGRVYLGGVLIAGAVVILQLKPKSGSGQPI
jgi:drug/metabolite transporter (DMT)-like permease